MIKASVDKTLVVGCIHTPYEDKKAVESTLDFAKYWKPNRLILNGDINDLYPLMKHRKDPDKARHLHLEIECGRDIRTKFRKAVGRDCEIIENQGNHEFRWESYLIDGAPELYGAFIEDFSFESVFRLADNNIRFNRGPGGYAHTRVGIVNIGHYQTLRKDSGATAKAIVLDSFGSAIAHHSHRMGTYGKATPNGRFIGQEGGCLCSMTPDYVSMPDWEQGFVIMQQQIGKARYHIDPVRVVGGNILFDGKFF